MAEARYGVRQAEPAGDALAVHAAAIRLQGFSVLASGLAPAELARLGDALDEVYRRQQAEIGGAAALAAIGDAWTARALLAYDDAFLALAAHPAVTALAARLMDGYVVLNQQNGLLNPPGQGFTQHAWHRDLPYQHFTASAPIALAALFCLDPFTAENGATRVLPGSHRLEAFPSDAAVECLAQTIAAPAGSFIVFDAMLFHRAGDNRSAAPRRAVNHVYARAFVRQQIDLPAMLGGRHATDPALRRLLGYEAATAPSVLDWRRARIADA